MMHELKRISKADNMDPQSHENMLRWIGTAMLSSSKSLQEFGASGKTDRLTGTPSMGDCKKYAIQLNTINHSGNTHNILDGHDRCNCVLFSHSCTTPTRSSNPQS